jgi:predicted SAM-dependent methyltransferase
LFCDVRRYRSMLSNPDALNLGCGVSYIKSPRWINLDWQSKSRDVKRHNLLAKLPVGDDSIELVYSSHLMEHLIREDCFNLLLESFRVLKPGGVIRLSLPDFEEMARAYVSYKDLGEPIKSQFVLTEIVDQCVRLTPSGRFPKWYKMANEDSDLKAFIELRTGIRFGEKSESNSPIPHEMHGESVDKLLALPRRLKSFSTKLYIALVLLLLPSWFRSYHVSRATPGERHMWLYDFSEMSSVLAKIGFENVSKVLDQTTRSSLKEVLTLDFDSRQRPKKGSSTMFIEASKPSR